MSGLGPFGAIKAIRLMTRQELRVEGWHDHEACMLIELEDGTRIYPSRDAEGNGPGCLFGMTKDGVLLALTPDEAGDPL